MFCVSQAHHINTLCGHLACFSEKASLLWQLWLSVWSHTPDWEERIKKHSPSWPEKCHASLLNLLLAKRQLRTGRRTQGGAGQEVAGLVGEFRMRQQKQRMCEARDAVHCGCDCCLHTVQGAACTACPRYVVEGGACGAGCFTQPSRPLCKVHAISVPAVQTSKSLGTWTGSATTGTGDEG